MNDIDKELLFRMAKLINSKTADSIQNYKSPDKLLGYVVQYFKNDQVYAIWFDAEKLSERDFRFIFKHHKLSDKEFFIKYLDGFYRIGFKNTQIR